MSGNLGVLIRALATAAACAILPAAVTAQPVPGAAPVRSESITGTISRIDSGSGTFDLLTGVGHSVRVRRVHYPAALRVTARRAEAGLPALVPGAVCRVACEVAVSGATATGVEVLMPAPGRTP